MSGIDTIWHNPRCSTSHFMLRALRGAGISVVMRDDCKQPLSKAELAAALTVLALAARDPGSGDPAPAMAANPAGTGRVADFAPGRARLHRPQQAVLDPLARAA